MSTIDALRQATASLHHHLDKRPVFRRLLARQWTLKDYRHLLSVYSTLYVPLEIQLYERSDLIRVLPDLPERCKTQLLARDFLDLKISPYAGPFDTTHFRWPSTSTLFGAIGCLYVLEGSTLGGRVIADIVKELLPMEGERGCAFLDSYGPRVDERWCEFKSAVNGLGASELDVRAAKEAAVDTFKCFITALDTMEFPDEPGRSRASDSQLR